MMQSDPQVSIIIVNYNGLQHIDACVSSVLKQDYGSYEVIFVDNASADGSLEYARAHYPGLVFIENKENLGYAAGINCGVKSARGFYIAPLNIDTEVDAKWLSSMVSFLEQNPQAGAVTPKILLFDDRKKINAMGHNLHFSGLSFCRRLNQEDKAYNIPEKVTGLSGCSYMLKKELWNNISDLVTDSFMANDDVILSWTLALMDHQIYVVPQAVVYHKYKLFMTPEKFYRLEKGRLELLFSSLNIFTLILMAPCLIFIELLQWAYCLLKGSKYLKAKTAVYKYPLKNKQKIRVKQNRFKQIRKISDFRLWGRLSWNLDWKQLIHITK